MIEFINEISMNKQNLSEHHIFHDFDDNALMHLLNTESQFKSSPNNSIKLKNKKLNA